MRTMLIEEQIKIARMIASGTPREVALLEFVPSAKYMKKTGAASEDNQGDGKNKVVPSPQAVAKKRAEDAKKKQDELSAQTKEVQDRKKVERLRRTKHKTRNALANAVKKSEYSKVKANAMTKITTKGDQGATAAQQAAGNVAKTAANVAKRGVAATKNVA